LYAVSKTRPQAECDQNTAGRAGSGTQTELVQISMAKIYTRTGDEGETSLLGGRRVRKDDLRIEAIGSIDETNAVLGLVRVEIQRGVAATRGMDDLLALIQHRLFDLGAELAASGLAAPKTSALDEADVAALESAIDQWEATLAPLTAFILPGGSAAAAQLHHARCVCRRAERRLVELALSKMGAFDLTGGGPVSVEAMRYINRLGDLLFVIARAVNAASGVPDVTWEQRK
jgi:cob(I)alamin adenosyltransferase